MSDEALRSWLADQGLGGLFEVLSAQDITLDVLGDLTEEDFRELGLSLGMRRRLQKALDSDPGHAREPPPAGAAQVSPDDSMAAQRRRITVVFIDLVGSTQMSEQMDPEDLGERINAFQECASEGVTRYGGFVARFMGDGLLAYFGYPTAHEDDAERAVRAGLDVVEAVGSLATEAAPAQVRVGIASGLVVVGDLISAGETRERSVVGDTPNLAARLQALAEPGQVVVSAATRRLVGNAFSLSALASQKIKGFEEPVTAFAVGAPTTERTRFDARGHAGLTPLLGRDMELSLLGERWDLACGGEGQAVLLVGEAGIGKSRITHALLEQIKAQGYRCLINQCSPLHLDTPLWPVLEQIRGALSAGGYDDSSSRRRRLDVEFAGSDAVSREGVALIAEALGFLASSDPSCPEMPAQQKRLRLLQAFVDRLLQLARRGPLLVVMEDVHWVDPTTRELLDVALDAIADAPVMLLMTTRPEAAPDLAGQTHVTKLTLNRLGRQAVRSIIETIAGNHGLPDEVLVGIVSRTDGVPLFVEELTKAMLETGSRAPLYPPSAGSAQLDEPIPDTLHDSLMARLDRVPAVKGVAQLAACIGREFDFSLLQSVSDMQADDLGNALDRLVSAGLIFQRGNPPSSRYTFKHALVRDAAYESMLKARCREVHARIADALDAARPPAPPELIALHAAHSGDVERAINGYLIAGDQAALASANAEAVSHYRQALELLSRLPAEAGRGERELAILQSLGVPLIAVRGYASPEVEEVFKRARGLCNALGIHDARAFMVLRGLWNCLYDRSELAESESLAESLVELAASHADAAEQALAWRALGSTLFVKGQLARGAEAFARVLETPQGWSTPATRALHGEAAEVVARQYAGWVKTISGQPDTGLELVEQGLARAREIELPIAVAFSLAILQLTHWLRGDAVACGNVVHETRALCQEQGFPFWGAHSDVFGGWAAAQIDPGPKALAQTRAGLEAWIRTGAVLHVPTWTCALAEVALSCGELDEAEAALERARLVAERNGELFMLPELLRLAAQVAIRRGAWDLARPLLERALDASTQQGSHSFALRAATDLAVLLEITGDARPMVSRLEQAMARVPEGHAGAAFMNARAVRERLAATR